ncbi:MAG TPA: hypothetical protein VK898_16755, partial [Chloroflexota bacterium]|nr:hypothetical protein [Chloroflexota bacterium]
MATRGPGGHLPARAGGMWSLWHLLWRQRVRVLRRFMLPDGPMHQSQHPRYCHVLWRRSDSLRRYVLRGQPAVPERRLC